MIVKKYNAYMALHEWCQHWHRLIEVAEWGLCYPTMVIGWKQKIKYRSKSFVFPISEIAKVAECCFSPVLDNMVPRLLCFLFQKLPKLQNAASLLSQTIQYQDFCVSDFRCQNGRMWPLSCPTWVTGLMRKDNTVETLLCFWFQMLLKLQNAACLLYTSDAADER